MRVNWFGYFPQTDGYGRFNTRLVQALQDLQADVDLYHIGELDRPARLLQQLNIGWGRLNITCAPPYMLKKVPGRHWLYSMTEGSRIPLEWVEWIKECGIERLFVPCQHNLNAFKDSGVRIPIHVLPGGTDPDEFPLLPLKSEYRPYTFLTFADRGFRKGWEETREAFYHAFGGKTMGNMEVRLIIKARKKDGGLLDWMSKNIRDADKRVTFLVDDIEDMRQVYAQAHCLVLPSRSEGWGMMHREAACSGLPVITQQYAGMDDGHTQEWAMVVESDYDEEVPKEAKALGTWRIANFQDIAQKMRYCFYSPETAQAFGLRAARWIRQNQTWHHSAKLLIQLYEEHAYGKEIKTSQGLRVGRSALQVS